MAPSRPESPIEKHLRRMMEVLDEGRKHHAEWLARWERQEERDRERWRHGEGHDSPWSRWAELNARGVEKWATSQARQVEKWASRVDGRRRRKELRRERRELRREQERARKERQREEDRSNPFQGWVFALAALVTLGMAVASFQRHWWLVFVALGLGSSAAGTFWRARQLDGGRSARSLEEGGPVSAPVSAPAAEAEDPRRARVDALCDKLLGELRAGPGVLRDVVNHPEQTVEGLRKSCHELARRERELRALSPPEEERRLEEERTRLSARVESETDAVVRERLEKALRLLDEQRRQRAELATSASRLEAEHMRLFYTLESLYTQVLRVRSADAASADVAGAGLRRSVEQLGLEMDAVASALEEVHGESPEAGPRGRVPTR